MDADPLAPPPLAGLPNLTPQPVGDLSDSQIGEFYAACDVVVFPSHAEGFGFPVLNALAARRPIFLRRLPVFLDLWETLRRTPNIHFYDATSELMTALANPPAWIDEPTPAPASGLHRAEMGARQIRLAMEAAMEGADHGRIVARIRATQLVSDLSDSFSAVPHSAQIAEAAQFVALGVERVARRALSVGPIYHGARLMFRTVRLGWRAIRPRRG